MTETVKTIPAKPVIVKPKVVDASPQLDAVATQIQKNLADYKSFLETRRISNDSAVKAAGLFAKAISALIANPTDDAFVTTLTFFRDNAKGVCSEITALNGINQAVNTKAARAQVIMVYNTFRCVTEKYVPSITENEFLNVVKSPALRRKLARVL